jgi:RecJ-like exonuclease
MKEKFLFIYESVQKAITDLNLKKINVEHAKAVASLAKQANNVIATQLDAAKFMANVEHSKDQLEKVGLDENKNK